MLCRGAPSAAVERQEGPVNVVEQERLFKVDPKMLDPDAEIRRVFGAKAVCFYLLIYFFN